MQELVLVLSSIAGACTAAAVKKFPKNKKGISNLSENHIIKNQINSLKIEKDILTKTISRLYQNKGENISSIQKDQLLIRYQHQLGVVIAKIEKLEEASKYPDLGPIGDGLVTLIDTKLSSLDKKLFELSSKITLLNVEANTNNQGLETNPQIAQPKSEDLISNKEKVVAAKPEVIAAKPEVIAAKPEVIAAKPEVIAAKTPKDDSKRVEITTLTELPNKKISFPNLEGMSIPHPLNKPIDAKSILESQEKLEIISPKEKPSEKSENKTMEHQNEKSLVPTDDKKQQIKKLNLPDEEDIDDSEDDLDKIKGDILKTLTKLEQAEVE